MKRISTKNRKRKRILQRRRSLKAIANWALRSRAKEAISYFSGGSTPLLDELLRR